MYSPELGQAVFGQPWQSLEPDRLTQAAIGALAGIWYALGDPNNDPFSNSGHRFDGDNFQVHAYSWEDEEQPFNLKWRDFTASWYKHANRGLSVNRQLNPDEVGEMISEFVREKFDLSSN